MTHFMDQLAQAVQDRGTPVMVGLDPRWDNLPESFRTCTNPSPDETADAYEAFCRGLIDVIAPLVPVIKPQMAFFEQQGPAGMVVLERLIRYAQQKGLLVVLDGKRNDIGSTATAYAQGLLGREQSAWGGRCVDR